MVALASILIAAAIFIAILGGVMAFFRAVGCLVGALIFCGSFLVILMAIVWFA